MVYKTWLMHVCCLTCINHFLLGINVNNYSDSQINDVFFPPSLDALTRAAKTLLRRECSRKIKSKQWLLVYKLVAEFLPPRGRHFFVCFFFLYQDTLTGSFGQNERVPRLGLESQGKPEGPTLLCLVKWEMMWVSGCHHDEWRALLENGDKRRCCGEGWKQGECLWGLGREICQAETHSKIGLSDAPFKVIHCTWLCCHL